MQEDGREKGDEPAPESAGVPPESDTAPGGGGDAGLDPPLTLARETTQRLGDSFELSVYESALEQDPESIELLVSLGDLYTRLGQLEKGLEMDRKLVCLQPDEYLFHYNLSCSQSLLGQVDDAFESLILAVELGYDDYEHLCRDPDLDNLRTDPRFKKIRARLQQRGP